MHWNISNIEITEILKSTVPKFPLIKKVRCAHESLQLHIPYFYLYLILTSPHLSLPFSCENEKWKRFWNFCWFQDPNCHAILAGIVGMTRHNSQLAKDLNVSIIEGKWWNTCERGVDKRSRVTRQHNNLKDVCFALIFLKVYKFWFLNIYCTLMPSVFVLKLSIVWLW